MIDISNCPISGLKRKVISKKLIWDEAVRQVIIDCRIGYFKQDNTQITDSERYKPYNKPLVASDSLVNPLTGVLLTTQQVLDYKNNINIGFTPIQEYDFYAVMSNIPIVLSTTIIGIIQIRDSQGKFDI